MKYAMVSPENCNKKYYNSSVNNKILRKNVKCFFFFFLFLNTFSHFLPHIFIHICYKNEKYYIKNTYCINAIIKYST